MGSVVCVAPYAFVLTMVKIDDFFIKFAKLVFIIITGKRFRVKGYLNIKYKKAITTEA